MCYNFKYSFCFFKNCFLLQTLHWPVSVSPFLSQLTLVFQGPVSLPFSFQGSSGTSGSPWAVFGVSYTDVRASPGLMLVFSVEYLLVFKTQTLMKHFSANVYRGKMYIEVPLNSMPRFKQIMSGRSLKVHSTYI